MAGRNGRDFLVEFHNGKQSSDGPGTVDRREFFVKTRDNYDLKVRPVFVGSAVFTPTDLEKYHRKHDGRSFIFDMSPPESNAYTMLTARVQRNKWVHAVQYCRISERVAERSKESTRLYAREPSSS